MKFASFGMIFLVINCLNPSGKSALVDEKFEDLVYIVRSFLRCRYVKQSQCSIGKRHIFSVELLL